MSKDTILSLFEGAPIEVFANGFRFAIDEVLKVVEDEKVKSGSGDRGTGDWFIPDVDSFVAQINILKGVHD